MKKYLFIILYVFCLHGCVTFGYVDFYTQIAPTKYPPTKKVMIFEYPNVDINEIYQLLFSDFLIIGKSSFNGPYENPETAEYFSKTIGADVLIATSQFKETRTSFVPMSRPESSTTIISGYSGGDYFYGTATNYGTKTVMVPVSVDRYDQHGLYLKNIKKIIPLWERTEEQYKKTKYSEVEGIWFNENYRLHLYRSGQQYVAFYIDSPKKQKGWRKGELKFIYGVDSGVGIYLMADKTPIPAKFNINKFGHLEITLLTNNEIFSFAKE